MDALKAASQDAYDYLMKLDPSYWARSFFPHDAACEHINSNFCESFNAMSKNMRDKPVIKIATIYAQLIMGLTSRRAALAAEWKDGDLVPAAMKLIGKMKDLVGKFHPRPAQANKVYDVTNIKSKKVFTVDIITKTCTCVQWQLREFPCQHAVCALVKFRPNWAK